MSTLITGGLGFIGSHVAVSLVEKGHDIIILDNLSNSHIEVLYSISKIIGFTPKFYQVDLLDINLLKNVFSENNVSSVIHLAGYKSIIESNLDPIKYYLNNLNSLNNLLYIMKVFCVKSFIFSSSASVYGPHSTSPFFEISKKEPLNPYANTKSISEDICFDISKSDEDMSICILRYFNPIGAHKSGIIGETPKGNATNLMPIILDVAKKRKDCIYIFGSDYPTKDGTCIRDFIHISDLADGHVSALNYTFKNKGLEIFNLGRGIGVSVLELINTFEAVTGISIPYKFSKRRTGDSYNTFANSDKAKILLAWKASRPLSEMCKDALNYYGS